MDPILYFTTFVAVVTLFASAIAVLVLVLFKLFHASHRFYRKLRDPEADAKPARQTEFEGWHPAHLKRAGQ
jgi:fumarate reductase subunit D